MKKCDPLGVTPIGGGSGVWGEGGGVGGRACLTSRNFAQKSAT